MNVRETGFDGLLLFEPKVFRDDRGFFLETFRADSLLEAGVRRNDRRRLRDKVAAAVMLQAYLDGEARRRG